MTRDKNWERFWNTGSVLDYLAYKGKFETTYVSTESPPVVLQCKNAVSCITEAKNEVDHTGSDSKGTDSRRKG